MDHYAIMEDFDLQVDIQGWRCPRCEPRVGNREHSAVIPFHRLLPISTEGHVAHVQPFECNLKGGPFSACTSPISYGYSKIDVLPQHNVFQVRAVDISGNKDPTPETFTFDCRLIENSISLRDWWAYVMVTEDSVVRFLTG